VADFFIATSLSGQFSSIDRSAEVAWNGLLVAGRKITQVATDTQANRET
jgi:hypothetical protein